MVETWAGLVGTAEPVRRGEAAMFAGLQPGSSAATVGCVGALVDCGPDAALATRGSYTTITDVTGTTAKAGLRLDSRGT
jgi:hypothetical protein